MCRSVSSERDVLCARGWSRVSGFGDRIERHRRWSAFAAAGVVACLLLAPFATAAKAAEATIGSESASALRDYVQSIEIARKGIGALNYNQDVGKTAWRYSDDSGFAALRAFTQQIGSEPVQPMVNATKLAEADNAVDALREFFQKKSEPAPAEKTPAPAPAAAKSKAPLVEAAYVGTKVCLGCHTSQAATFEHTLMGRLMQQGKLQCESCHGPGSEHARLGGGRGVGGIISFRKEDNSRTAEENNAICLGCHERGDRTNWEGSVHQERGIACTNCHTIMKAVSRKNQLKTAFEPDTCFQCHKDRKAQMFRSSHMPMREGKIVCSNCHNPHGSFTEALLRKDSINDTCYTCHAEKRGPFLFEHEPVRENCDNCHDPHGTAIEYSLKLMRPRLCFECHSFGHANTTGLSSVFTMGRSCQNCHTAIHGSNSPAGAALQR